MQTYLSSSLLPMTQTLNRIALFFVGSIAVFPLLVPYHIPPAPSFHGEWLAFGLGLGACVALLSRDVWNNLPVPKIAIYFLALLILVAIQSLVVEHVYRSQALYPGLYLGWAVMLAAVTVWLRMNLGTEKIIDVLAWFIVVGGLLQAMTGIIQYLNIYGWLDSWVFHKVGDSVIGNAAQSNHLATHVALSAFALTYLFAKRRVSSVFAFALSVVLATALTLSTSRTVFLYLAAALILSGYALWKLRGPVYFRCALMSGLLLMLVAAGQYLLPLIDEPLRATLRELGFELSELKLLTAMTKSSASGIQDRLTEWHKAWLMFLQSPILGVGMGHYGWHSFEMHGQPDFDDARTALFGHPHNLFMEILAELGLAGILLLALLLFGWLRQFLRNWGTPEHWLIAVVLLTLIIHSGLEYPLWFSYFLGIAAIFLALGENRVATVRFAPHLGRAGVTISLFLAFAILILTFDGYRRLADSHINVLIARQSPEHAARVLKAISMNPLLTPWAEAAMVTHGNPDKNTMEKQLEVTTRLWRYNPSPIRVYYQIVYLAMADKNEEAVSLLRHAARAYAPEFSKYICRLKQLPYPEVLPLIAEGEKLLGETPECPAEVEARFG